jgi:pimeloyl-ACP methyl ester carboxylesterase/DNA-binding CsgD family transcriptional regulator
VRQARTEARAFGLVETVEHGVLSALASRADVALNWPGLAQLIESATPWRPATDDVVIAAFAPSRSRAMVLRAAEALGLSPLEARISAALLYAPSLEAAAREAGVGRATAKDALDGALRKTGAKGASQLVGRIVDLSCGADDRPRDWASTARASGLSPAETRIAEQIADGVTAQAMAVRLGLTEQTVKSYRKAIFAKLGINRSRDLRRLLAEAGELERLSQSAQVVSPGADGLLRATVGPDGRRVAVIDYGPASGRPILILHGYTTGRLAAPPLLNALRCRGFRVIVPQRPGFGLTSAAEGDYLQTAVRDMALVLDRLELRAAAILARDGGAASAIGFAAAFPERITSGVLLNPRPPIGLERRVATPFSALSAMLLRHPELIEGFAAMMQRQTRRDLIGGVLRRAFADIEADRLCFEVPANARHMIDDHLGLVGRFTAGFCAENLLFADGWEPPATYAGPRWRLAFSDGLTLEPPGLWASVGDGAPALLEDAGLLAQFTHADALAELIDPDGSTTPKSGGAGAAAAP